jgi:glycosyltransferase involved in cell wall biosynthesis/predicted  nucleic acid-binding Zn-ribbon protein
MRILHIVHGFSPEFFGGTEHYVKRIAHAQLEQGHEVEILAGTIRPGEPGIESETHEGLLVHRLRRGDLFFERWDRGASGEAGAFYDRFLAERRPELVHLHHWIRLSRDLIRRTRAAGIPAIATCHDLYASCPRIFRVREEASFCERKLCADSCASCVPRPDWMDEALVRAQVEWFRTDFCRELGQACALLAPSRAIAEGLIRFTEIPGSRFEVTPHATLLDWPELEPRTAWEPGCGRPLVLAHWGHLMPTKGVHLLLEALHDKELVALLDKTGERIELELWGEAADPGYSDKLEEQMQGLTVRRHGRFDVDDLLELRADVAIFPSVAYESYSFVVDEAFGLRMPILVSDRGALPERCGDAGLIFAPDDAQALGAALRRILQGEARIDTMQAAIPPRRSVVDHVHKLQAIYERVSGELEVVPATARLPEEGTVLRATEEVARKLTAEIERLTTELKHLQHAFADQQRSVGEFRDRIADMDSDLGAHRARRGEIEEELATLRALNSEQQRDLEAHRKLKVELQADLEAHRKTRTELETDLEAHRARKGELEQEVMDLKTECQRIQGEYDQVETWLREAAEREKGYGKTIEDLSRNREELQKRALEAEQHLVGLGTDLEDARRLLAEREGEVAERSAELGRMRAERDALSSERDELSTKQDALITERDTLSAERDGLLAERDRLAAENRFALPLVMLARAYFRLRDRIRKKS